MLRPTRSNSETSGPAGELAYAGRGQHKVLLLAMHYEEGAVEPDSLRIQSLLDRCDAATFSVAQQDATRVGYATGNISKRIPFCEPLDPHVIALDYFWQQGEYYRRPDRYHSNWFDGKIQQCFSDARSLRAFLIPYNNEGDVARMKSKAAVGFRSFDMTLEDARRLHPLFVATQLIDRELRGYSDRGASGGTFQGRFNEAQCRWLAEPAFACVYREGDTEEAVRDFLGNVGLEAVKLLAELEASKAAAARQPDDDPLLLDGCTINVKWPHKGETRDRTGVVKFKPKPGGQRRYVVRMKWHGDGTREKSTNWKHLKRREYKVMSSPYKKKGHRWTDTELEAAKRRRRAPVRESDESIGISLGRTGAAVGTKLRQTLNPELEPQGGKVGGRRPSKDWRGKVIRAMEQMPGQRGTVQDVCAKVEEILGKNNPLLDRSVRPGAKTMEKWQQAVHRALGQDRDVFRRTEKKKPNIAHRAGGGGTRRELSVWEYIPPVEGLQPRKSAKEILHELHGPKQPSKATAIKKSLNKVKAFRK